MGGQWVVVALVAMAVAAAVSALVVVVVVAVVAMVVVEMVVGGVAVVCGVLWCDVVWCGRHKGKTGQANGQCKWNNEGPYSSLGKNSGGILHGKTNRLNLTNCIPDCGSRANGTMYGL